MKRPLAYITAAWCGSDHENTKLAAQYCRTVYEAVSYTHLDVYKRQALTAVSTPEKSL